VAVLDLELDHRPRPVEGLDGYARAWILLRYRGRPVGSVVLPVQEGRIAPRAWWPTLLEAGGNDLKSRILDAWLGTRGGTSTMPADESSTSGVLPPATVAVCTRERPDDLRACLAALAHLPGEGHEVLVVDNDPATEVTRGVASEFSGIRYVREPRRGLNVARNRALREARNQVVAFTDDDAVTDPGWLPALLTAFDHPRTLCVTGLTVPLELETRAQQLHEEHSPFGRGFHRKVFDAARFHPMASGHAGAGVNMALRREVTSLAGPFDEALDAGTPTRSGGDNEMFSRILAAGYRIVYEPSAVSRHRHRKTRSELRRAFFGYGVGVYAAWTRSLVRERETGVLGVAASWLVKRQIPTLLRTLLLHPRTPPLDLLLAELAGCALGPWAYWRAARTLRREATGPAGAGEMAAS
jgi:GT2 family glycosyltransferase